MRLSKDEIIGIVNGKLIRVCNRCKCEVVYDDWGDLVSPNYDCACLVCDEDLDFSETKLIERTFVMMFITEEDKEYYLEHGHLPIEKLEWLKEKEEKIKKKLMKEKKYL